MSYTLNGISSKIIRRLSGGNQSKDSTIDRREVIDEIRDTMNQMLKLEILQKMGLGDRTLPALYIATYGPLAIEDNEGEYYTTLPDNFLSLPYNRGVHQVYKAGQVRTQLIRRNQPYVSTFLRVNQLQGNQGYYVEGRKLIYDTPLKVKKDDKVTVKLLIAAPSTIGPDDPLPILPEQVHQIEEEVTRSLMGARIPEDRVNDETELAQQPQQ